MKYTVPDLAYDFNALEPYIDEKTMKIHHDKHHAGYVNNLNDVVGRNPCLQEGKLEDLMMSVEDLNISESDKTAFINNGGGHLNHSLFWEIMAPEKEVDETLVSDIKSEFGSVDAFKEVFENSAKTRFGSGWAWLVRTDENKLKVYSTANQNSPYLNGDIPLIGIDVWEHAYYLKYQNLRPDYIKAWWNVLKVIE